MAGEIPLPLCGNCQFCVFFPEENRHMCLVVKDLKQPIDPQLTPMENRLSQGLSYNPKTDFCFTPPQILRT